MDNDADYVTPLDMLAELRDDNKQLVAPDARACSRTGSMRQNGEYGSCSKPPGSAAVKALPMREARAKQERLLNESLEQTFPVSDAISMQRFVCQTTSSGPKARIEESRTDVRCVRSDVG
jgi:hypothetical protein